MNNEYLTIDSRIISHLGEALISDERVALLELIKNSYDADSLKCNIVINTKKETKHGVGELIIFDNGNGMDLNVIISAFLKIATNFKSKNQKFSPRFHRLSLGSKGIGRLALNQLGNYIEVLTVPNLEVFPQSNSNISNEGYQFEIDWRKYEEEDKSLEDITISIENISKESFKEISKFDHGTFIKVKGLKSIEHWEKKDTLKKLEKDLLSYLNPFVENDVKFVASINLNNQKIRSDIYDVERLESYADSVFDFEFHSTNKQLSMTIIRNRQYIMNRVENLIKQLKKHGYSLAGNEQFPYDDFYEKFKTDSSVIVLEENELLNKLPTFKKTSLNVSLEGEIYLPGDFKGKFYGYTRTHKGTKGTSISEILSNIQGVKLYRNNFRIFPYGEFDWLKFATITRQKFNHIFAADNTIGYVFIDGEENLEKLSELTSREGLVQNAYGENFLKIMQDVVAYSAASMDFDFRKKFDISNHAPFKKISNFDREINYPQTIKLFSDIREVEFTRQIDFIEETKTQTNLIEENISHLGKISSKINDVNVKKQVEDLKMTIEENNLFLKNNVTLIEKSINEEKNLLNIEREHLKSYYPIIGATLVAEMLSHEIVRLSNRIRESSKKIRDHVNTSNLSDMSKVLMNLNIIDSNSKFLIRYAAMLDVNSSSKRRKYEIFDLKKYLEQYLQTSPITKYGDTTIVTVLKGDSFEVRAVKENLNIILENLYINSLYWAQRAQNMNAIMHINISEENRKLIIWDNGIGINPKIQDNLFEPFQTLKPVEDGKGMGLFIVKELLKEIKADIRLLNDINEFGNKYKFEISFE